MLLLLLLHFLTILGGPGQSKLLVQIPLKVRALVLLATGLLDDIIEAIVDFVNIVFHFLDILFVLFLL